MLLGAPEFSFRYQVSISRTRSVIGYSPAQKSIMRSYALPGVTSAAVVEVDAILQNAIGVHQCFWISRGREDSMSDDKWHYPRWIPVAN